MADNIQSDDFSLSMARFSKETTRRINDLLTAKDLENLVEIKNPLDINPGADDEAHVRIVACLASDRNVDAVVVGLDPLSPALRTLTGDESARYSFDDPHSIARALPEVLEKLEKPVVGVVDGGRMYDALVDELVARGVAVFRSSDRAVQALAIYIEGRLHAQKLTDICPAQ